MSSPVPDGRNSASIPVLCMPDTVEFSESKFKHITTLYNPLNTDLEFEVMSTHPAAFEVVPDKGTVSQKSRVHIVFRLKEYTQTDQGLLLGGRAKFKVIVADKQRNLSGSQTLPVVSDIPNPPRSSSSSSSVQPNSKSATRLSTARQLSNKSNPAYNNNTRHRGEGNAVFLPSSSSSSSSSFGRALLQPVAGSGTNSLAQVLTLVARLLPLSIGVGVMVMLTSEDYYKAGPDSNTVWIAFFIGMVTMLFTSKLSLQ
jgi:hypothetical protein